MEPLEAAVTVLRRRGSRCTGRRSRTSRCGAAISIRSRPRTVRKARCRRSPKAYDRDPRRRGHRRVSVGDGMSSTTLAASPRAVEVAWRVLSRAEAAGARPARAVEIKAVHTGADHRSARRLLVGASLERARRGLDAAYWRGAPLPFYSGGPGGSACGSHRGYLWGFVLSQRSSAPCTRWDRSIGLDRGDVHRRGRPVRGRDPVAHAGCRSGPDRPRVRRRDTKLSAAACRCGHGPAA